MLTPQEIQEKEFEKAVFGGYAMAGVDEFLGKTAEDYGVLYKENAILKSKIKVLVEKVEEYRSTEDSMRRALLTAQREGESILAEAGRKSAAQIAETERELRERQSELEKQFFDERARLEAARAETIRFVAASEAIIAKHTEFLSRLSAVEHVPAPQPKQPLPTQEDKIVNTARAIDSAVEKITAISAADANADESEPTKPYRALTEQPEDDSPIPASTKIDFENLKFGKNV